MKMNITKQIGKNTYHFQVEGKNLFEVIMESQKLSFQNVYKCGICDGDALYLRAYITEKDKYEYVKVVCANPDCKASLTFGKKKGEEDTYFLRRKEGSREYDWQEYKGNGKTNGNSDSEDTPF